MLKFLGLIILVFTACTTVVGSDPGSFEATAQARQALYQGPALIGVPMKFTVGESWNLHEVTFPKLFALDETEVTVAHYADCVTAEACTTPSTDTDCTWGVVGLESHPVNCITYYQAVDYCAWAGKRLPTQEEWELAARYNDGRTYPWGSDNTGYETKINTNRLDDGYAYTAPVGSFPDGNSALGLKDMAGNVREWTQSSYHYVGLDPCTNCPEGETCVNPCEYGNPSYRFYKGGSYGEALAYSRPAYLNYGTASTGHPFIGFRCAVTQ